jgi:hypothetical protein
MYVFKATVWCRLGDVNSPYVLSAAAEVLYEYATVIDRQATCSGALFGGRIRAIIHRSGLATLPPSSTYNNNNNNNKQICVKNVAYWTRRRRARAHQPPPYQHSPDYDYVTGMNLICFFFSRKIPAKAILLRRANAEPRNIMLSTRKVKTNTYYVLIIRRKRCTFNVFFFLFFYYDYGYYRTTL